MVDALANDPLRSSAGAPALFLHSGFRTGSTWFWNRYRRSARTSAFYEPFNEALASLTAERIAEVSPWPSGHPALDRPCFAEYAPLLCPGGGVTNFDVGFAYRNYFATEDDERQRRYLATLMDSAWQAGKIPVLGFCRSFGRLPWFRRHCPGLHIATWRNPWDQWASYHEQAIRWGNGYFEFRAFLIASIGRASPAHAEFFADLNLAPFPGPSGATEEESLHPLFYASHVDQRFRVFLRVFMFDMLMALQHADLLIDLDHMSLASDYRAQVTTRLRHLSGLPDLSFDDCALPRHRCGDDGAYISVMEEGLRFLDRYSAQHSAEPRRLQATAQLRDRLEDCLRQMVEGSARERGNAMGDADGKTSGEDDFGIDRFLLCHLLQACRCQHPQQAVAYLQSVFGTDWEWQKLRVIQMAEFIENLGAPTVLQDRQSVTVLRQALLAETPSELSDRSG